MKQSDEYQAIRDIADAICEEQVTPEQIQQLELLLKGKPDAKRFYLDYMGIHTYLSAAAEDNMEFVYRRIQTQTAEEFIVRPSGQISTRQVTTNESMCSEPSDAQQSSTKVIADTPVNMEPAVDTGLKLVSARWRAAKFGGSIVVLCLLVATLTWLAIDKHSQKFSAEIIEGRLSIVKSGHIDEPYLYIGEYEVTQDAQIKLNSGDIIQLVKHSSFKLLNNHEIELKRGAVSLSSISGQDFVIQAPSFSLHANGSDMALDLRAEKPIVTSGNKTLLIPNRWRPMHYWAFDSQTDRAIDSAGLAHGIVSFAATRTSGLVGTGAFHFNNSFDARINVGSGGGTVPASGSFAVTDGVTIEALVQPQFSAEIGDMDEIFRKDQADKEMRMLLSFQHDKVHKSYLKPDGRYKESLSFGLFLLGQGYQELKLPLDGLDGRPSLAQLKDGNSHHIVATYNVSTGLKAIYVDGIQHAAYQYPAGSKMISGGAGTANIGNSPNQPVPVRPTDVRFARNEAFAGVIDEVAFYNFALPAFMVQQHYRQINQGYNYFGLLPSAQALPEQIELTLPPHSTLECDPVTGLPNLIAEQ